MIDPKIRIPHRTKVRQLIEERYKEVTSDVYKRLRGSSRVSIALDTWTSPNKLAFMSVTAYMISDAWEYQEHLICFEHLSGSHTGQNMARVVAAALQEYGLSERLFAVTADNASNNNTLRQELAQRLQQDHRVSWYAGANRVPCLAHVVQLVVQAMIKQLKIEAPNHVPAAPPSRSDLNDVQDGPQIGKTIKKVS
jgi:hypothetical protein